MKTPPPDSAYRRKLRLQFALACLPFLITAPAIGQLLSGYSLPPKDLTGPVQSLIATDPIWVVDYHTLVIDYRASGHLNPAAAVLTLRPGSVGPVTPRATNPENPFVEGGDIIAVRASDLIFDGGPHRLSVDLRGKSKEATSRRAAPRAACRRKTKDHQPAFSCRPRAIAVCHIDTA